MLIVASCLSEGGRVSLPAGAADPGPDPVVLAAGDVAQCNDVGDEATANLVKPYLEAHANATVAMLGDGAYPFGSSANYRDCYGPTWGQFKDRTHPATGNHEYEGKGQERAGPYFDYWGSAAGPRPQGYYSYDLGVWHVVVINSTCGESSGLDGCDAGSSMGRWLEDDLSKTPAQCILAYWHHPVFYSMTLARGQVEKNPPVLANDDTKLAPLWKILEAHGVDAVVAGHHHVYERFARQTLTDTKNGQNHGAPDDVNGIREIVVGTGGGVHEYFERDAAGNERADRAAPNSEKRIEGVWGVLELTLHPATYDWRFLSAGTGTQGAGEVLDSGNSPCRAP